MEDKIFDCWVAGFWEGEGSLSLTNKNRYVAQISQALDKDRDVEVIMNKIKDTYGGHIGIIKHGGKYKDLLQWRVSKGIDVINFIKRIYPYCQFRRFQLDNFLIYVKENPQHFTKFVNMDFTKAKKLREEGLTYSKIGEILNLPPSTIWKRINLYASVGVSVILSIL